MNVVVLVLVWQCRREARYATHDVRRKHSYIGTRRDEMEQHAHMHREKIS
jgi:hypothetical protein